ncbi:hypothetical protein [Flavitalea sp.]|nr:hypothetical protein [Flavitalea sp.]
MSNTREPINDCLQLIEHELNWGDSSQWGNYDFGQLSDLIQAKTGVLLSVTTLKRLWGKLKYDNLPSVTTLNTLARFLNYADWREFRQRDIIKSEIENYSDPNNVTGSEVHEMIRPRKNHNVKRFTIAGLVAFLVIIALVSLTTKKKPLIPFAPDATQFEFKADKIVGEGVPNSVVFTYDASAATTDSVYIVQSWDINRKTLVSRTGTNHSAIYYYPGYFRTRLIADGAIVKSHDLQITSGGWLCLAEQEPSPLYFKKEQYLKDDRIEIDSNALKTFGLSLHPKPPRIRFFNQGDMGDLMNDNFVFETTLKNAFNEGTGVCQKVQVLIQCKNDIIIIPLSAPACVGDLNLYAAGTGANSKEADLSKFGCDLDQWTKLKVVTVNAKMTFYVNDVEAYSLKCPNQPTGIVGVQYRFDGLGAVKDTRFISEGKIYNL